jgi:hypothetical protein
VLWVSFSLYLRAEGLSAEQMRALRLQFPTLDAALPQWRGIPY